VPSHPAWHNPPLREAVFEIRFPPVDDYAIFVGGMAATCPEKFSTHEHIQPFDMPPFIKVDGFVKHRFYTENRGLLFQTGNDVISVNSIDYLGFDSFLKEVESILKVSEKFIKINLIKRLSIRYINCFEDVQDMFSILTINPPFSDIDSDKSKNFSLRHIKKITDSIYISINVQYPGKDNKSDKLLFLDVESFCDFGNDNEWDIQEILAWCTDAHGYIWENFYNLVSDSEKELRV